MEGSSDLPPTSDKGILLKPPVTRLQNRYYNRRIDGSWDRTPLGCSWAAPSEGDEALYEKKVNDYGNRKRQDQAFRTHAEEDEALWLVEGQHSVAWLFRIQSVYKLENSRETRLALQARLYKAARSGFESPRGALYDWSLPFFSHIPFRAPILPPHRTNYPAEALLQLVDLLDLIS